LAIALNQTGKKKVCFYAPYYIYQITNTTLYKVIMIGGINLLVSPIACLSSVLTLWYYGQLFEVLLLIYLHRFSS